METEEIIYEKVYESPRPPPKISLRNDWMKELGSELARQAEDNQPTQTQPNPNPIYRTVRPVVTEQTSRSSAQEIDARFSLNCKNTNLFVDCLEKDKDTDKDVDADRDRTGRPVVSGQPTGSSTQLEEVDSLAVAILVKSDSARNFEELEKALMAVLPRFAKWSNRRDDSSIVSGAKRVVRRFGCRFGEASMHVLDVDEHSEAWRDGRRLGCSVTRAQTPSVVVDNLLGLHDESDELVVRLWMPWTSSMSVGFATLRGARCGLAPGAWRGRCCTSCLTCAWIEERRGDDR